MNLLSKLLFVTLLSGTHFANAFKITEDNYEHLGTMIMEGLEKGPKPELVNCSLPEDLLTFINDPKNYRNRLNACKKAVKKSGLAGGIPKACEKVEGIAAFFDFDLEGRNFDEALTEQVKPVLEAIDVTAPKNKGNKAVLKTSAMCPSEDENSESDGGNKFYRIIGLIDETVKPAKLEVIKVLEGFYWENHQN